MADEPPAPAKLADPASTPRLPDRGSRERDRVIFREAGGEGLGQWEVEVTPLLGATQTGRSVTGGRQKPRATFEVRAAYFGTGLAEFGSQPNTRLIPHAHTEDEELAMAIARVLVEALRSGNRDLNIVTIGKDVERRRGAY